MATKCRHCPLRQYDIFHDMTAEDARVMQQFKVGELVVDAGTTLLLEGSNSPQLYTALRGSAIRYKLLPNGARQVINFVFPGDFIGLQAAVLGEMQHSVEASSKMTLCVFDRSAIWEFFRSNPQRAYSLTWLAAVEEHFLGESLATIGQRTALQSVAWALLRLYRRGLALNLVEKNVLRLRFKQADLADALGLSVVHTNKTLAILRKRQLASWRDGKLQVNDQQALAEIALVDLDKPLTRPLF